MFRGKAGGLAAKNTGGLRHQAARPVFVRGSATGCRAGFVAIAILCTGVTRGFVGGVRWGRLLVARKEPPNNFAATKSAPGVRQRAAKAEILPIKMASNKATSKMAQAMAAMRRMKLAVFLFIKSSSVQAIMRRNTTNDCSLIIQQPKVVVNRKNNVFYKNLYMNNNWLYTVVVKLCRMQNCKEAWLCWKTN